VFAEPFTPLACAFGYRIELYRDDRTSSFHLGSSSSSYMAASGIDTMTQIVAWLACRSLGQSSGFPNLRATMRATRRMVQLWSNWDGEWRRFGNVSFATTKP